MIHLFGCHETKNIMPCWQVFESTKVLQRYSNCFAHKWASCAMAITDSTESACRSQKGDTCVLIPMVGIFEVLDGQQRFCLQSRSRAYDKKVCKVWYINFTHCILDVFVPLKFTTNERDCLLPGLNVWDSCVNT